MEKNSGSIVWILDAVLALGAMAALVLAVVHYRGGVDQTIRKSKYIETRMQTEKPRGNTVAGPR